MKNGFRQPRERRSLLLDGQTCIAYALRSGNRIILTQLQHPTVSLVLHLQLYLEEFDVLLALDQLAFPGCDCLIELA